MDRTVWLSGMGILVLFLLTTPAIAAGDTFTVTSETEGSDETPGDGVCATAANTCTVRAAVEEANALEGSSTISIPSGTYVLSSSLVISQAMTLNGADPRTTILDANRQDRVLTIGDTENLVDAVHMTGLTVRGGELLGSGGGILIFGNLLLDTVVITDNHSRGGFGNNGGGLVVPFGSSVVITNSTIARNTSEFNGGAIVNVGAITMTNSTISSNASNNYAGGIWMSSGSSLALNHVTLADNGTGIENSFGIAPLQLQNTLLVDGLSSQSGVITSLGGNVSTSNNQALTHPTDRRVGWAAQLVEPLADNGGPTPTHMLLPASDARDVTSDTCLPVDQRGVEREPGAACDSGAVEAPPVSHLVLYLPLMQR